MKKIFVSMLVMTVVAGVAAANVQHKTSTEEVNQAIDARLHAMLVKLNAEKK
ncbi:MAG: hypothetical protein U0228_03580 [Myxococcaceae bacterium]